MINPVELLLEMVHLMELKGENPFKIRAMQKAAHVLGEETGLEERAKAGTLTQIPGIGKGIEVVLKEFLIEGRTTALDELKASLPLGLLELTQVPGLGPKKAKTLIEELGIQSLAELEYACRENRLLNLKGFGEKAQKKILEGVIFQSSNQGLKKYSEVHEGASSLLQKIQTEFKGIRMEETGALRRKVEILDRLEFIVEIGKNVSWSESEVKRCAAEIRAHQGGGLPVEIHFSKSADFGYQWAKTTASDSHWKGLGTPSDFKAKDEAEFYEHLGYPWISPEMRETGEELILAKSGALSKILPWDGVKGVFHNHTTRSDGIHSLDQMVGEAQRLGFEYIGISDHSQSAFYAQGLKTDTLKVQKKEIRKVQEKYPAIRVFWGIESDILADGSLDYDTETLKCFDFVIASIHSRFQMDRDAMTQRILTAIRNPSTRFLGHVTGRLLLGRKGYDLDMDAILKEAADRDVAVELNSNPARLDIDWRWGPSMRREKTLTSINPDAHELEGLADIQYGISMARKALLPSSLVVNSRSCAEVEKWLRRK